MEFTQILFGLFLATIAGLSTTVGAVAVFFIKENSRFISFSMGFSAGVMIGVAILELLPQSMNNLGLMPVGFAFICGMIVVGVLDFMIPHEYMHEHSCEDTHDQMGLEQENGRLDRLARTGRLVAIGIAIHNLPEGFATMTGSLFSPELGIVLAIAIALHNIPEGLSVAIPIYVSSGDKKKAFKLSFLSGLAEPVGAIISLVVIATLGYTFPEIIELSLAFVAGIMVFISLDELLPSARENCIENGDDSHTVTIGIILGLIVIFLTLLLLIPMGNGQ
jgi:ZIP family zinc transporter